MECARVQTDGGQAKWPAQRAVGQRRERPKVAAHARPCPAYAVGTVWTRCSRHAGRTPWACARPAPPPRRPCLDGQKQWNRLLWMRLARAPEAVAGRSPARPLPLRRRRSQAWPLPRGLFEHAAMLRRSSHMPLTRTLSVPAPNSTVLRARASTARASSHESTTSWRRVGGAPGTMCTGGCDPVCTGGCEHVC